MIRATTPTHTFTFPASINTNYSEILITYSQNNHIVLEITKDDLTINDKVATYKLTQEQTRGFKDNESVEFQVRVKTTDGTVSATKIQKLPVSRVLNDKEL